MTFDFSDEVYQKLLKDKEIRFYMTHKPNAIIPFPIIYRRMGILWHFSKDTSKKILEELERRKLIEIVNFHGIKILKL